MEMTDAEQYRHVRRIKEKYRYATDPAYREMKRQRAASYYAANREKAKAYAKAVYYRRKHAD